MKFLYILWKKSALQFHVLFQERKESFYDILQLFLIVSKTKKILHIYAYHYTMNQNIQKGAIFMEHALFVFNPKFSTFGKIKIQDFFSKNVDFSFI